MHDKHLAQVILLKPTAVITGELFFTNFTSSPLLGSRTLVNSQFRNFNSLTCKKISLSLSLSLLGKLMFARFETDSHLKRKKVVIKVL